MGVRVGWYLAGFFSAILLIAWLVNQKPLKTSRKMQPPLQHWFKPARRQSSKPRQMGERLADFMKSRV